LFIITHQAFELWFKQILHELHSIQELFAQVPINEQDLYKIVGRLGRIVRIQKLINQQFNVLESMTPLDFLDFRDDLTPASGFQSVQFREIELCLGLCRQLKPVHFGRFETPDRDHLKQIAQQASLFELLDAWLLRMPFLKFGDFDFWKTYQGAVDQMLIRDAETITHNPFLKGPEKTGQLRELDQTRSSFACLFDAQRYREQHIKGNFRLSHASTLAALFIALYREEPLLQLPFELLTRLMDIDEELSAWRSLHAVMVHRMVGRKIGTGGSSGHDYLKATIERQRIFADLFNLSTFLIPRSALPELPEEVKSALGFSSPRDPGH
ncbi:MAG: tryptophan 2,3-dioxygenase, partial [Methylococcaceae bacterium]|nr:tryptophan 2,3-dioxygenase [Methylococcaceae bacterium]